MGLVYTDKEWEDIVRVAKERLARLANYVKETIFVVHTFPFVYMNRTFLNDALDKGAPIDWAHAPTDWKKRPQFDMPKAQEKLDEIINSCPKCEQFDYTPQFLINGTFYPYDPQYIIPYVNQGHHFTQPGLEKIRPVYTDICNRIGQQ